MKRIAVGAALAAVGFGCIAAYLLRASHARRVPTPDNPDVLEQTPLSVDDVARRPDRYPGRLAVRGVVQFVSAEEATVVLISEAEFAKCGATCPEILLPVRWQGPLPSVTDRVLVRGQVQKTARGSLFVATSNDVVERGQGK